VNEVQRGNAGALFIDAQLRRLEWNTASGEQAEMEALLAEARSRNPEHVALNRTLGALSLGSGRIDDALDYVAAALRTRPEDALALKTRALALHQKNNLPAAIGAYNLALAQRPEDAELLNGLGAAHAARNSFEVARRYFKRALASDPAHQAATDNLEQIDRILPTQAAP
jgi:tetratricopeptide (TPR) repeat protein